MQCPKCNEPGRKFGKDRDGNQRFQCVTCHKTFADRPASLLGDMRLDMDKVLQVLQLLLEGMSVRATMRGRVHLTLKTTPAVAAGLEAKPWTLRELIERSTQY